MSTQTPKIVSTPPQGNNTTETQSTSTRKVVELLVFQVEHRPGVIASRAQPITINGIPRAVTSVRLTFHAEQAWSGRLLVKQPFSESGGTFFPIQAGTFYADIPITHSVEPTSALSSLNLYFKLASLPSKRFQPDLWPVEIEVDTTAPFGVVPYHYWEAFPPWETQWPRLPTLGQLPRLQMSVSESPAESPVEPSTWLQGTKEFFVARK
ncbi:hypothetical protein LZ554_008910 [Drepanopeziza brunnea f. sp. 'monogermtubi']|nr:hypothetical protein LZ554_008910 [Drepanopeziza brunnea f. sp. 'monogermtubi']